ncbi:hypothetical protein BH11MYX1_BH11MYX1_31610 [soil metagenome]
MDRRRALRVPVRGVAVFSGTHATIENLSAGGALFLASGAFELRDFDIELKLGLDSGSLGARTVRVERLAEVTRIAVEFGRVEPELQAAIEAAIEAAIRAAARRPVLVVDDQGERRSNLVASLTARGMTPLAPTTPLEAIDLLARSHLHINVALLASPSSELREMLREDFPWVTAEDISNDLEATVNAAADAWSASDTARLAVAMA